MDTTSPNEPPSLNTCRRCRFLASNPFPLFAEMRSRAAIVPMAFPMGGGNRRRLDGDADGRGGADSEGLRAVHLWTRARSAQTCWGSTRSPAGNSMSARSSRQATRSCRWIGPITTAFGASSRRRSRRCTWKACGPVCSRLPTAGCSSRAVAGLYGRCPGLCVPTADQRHRRNARRSRVRLGISAKVVGRVRQRTAFLFGAG